MTRDRAQIMVCAPDSAGRAGAEEVHVRAAGFWNQLRDNAVAPPIVGTFTGSLLVQPPATLRGHYSIARIV